MREVGSGSWEIQEWGSRGSLAHGKGGQELGKVGGSRETGKRPREHGKEGTGKGEFQGVHLDPSGSPLRPP